jgi:uncharacterized protein (TIGR03437 family)
VPQAGELIVLRPSTTGTPATLTPLGSGQNIALGESGSVGVRVLGANGQPLTGSTVQFATTSAGVQLSSTSVTTDGEGIATVTVTLPSTYAQQTASITATSGGAAAQTLTVNATAALPPPGGGSGSGGSGVLETGLNPISGQGQVVGDQTFNTNPLVARLTDANGQPISGATVTWNITQGGGQILNATTTTDAAGEVRAQYQPAPILLPQFTPVVSASIQATASTGHSTTFYVNVLPFTNPNILVALEEPIDNRLTIRAGQTLEDAIRVQVQSATGNAIPNAGIELITSGDPATTPSVRCNPRFGLTGSSGVGTCNVVAGGRAGSVQATLRIGNQRDIAIDVEVTPGVANTLTAEAGSNQTAAPGARLLNLVVRATDNFNSPVAGTQIAWEIPSGFTTLSTQTTTDLNGRAVASLSAPQTGGTYAVRARSGSLAATFNITVSSPISQIVKVSGDNQTAAAGAVFSVPLRVRLLNPSGAPAPGIPVSFNVTSGSATVSQQAVTTDQSGEAVILASAGQTPGPVVVTASSGNINATFSLTVAPPGPVFSLGDIMNAASFRSGLAPGSIAYIRASRIAPNVRGTVTPYNVVGPLPTSLAGVQVLFNGVPAPIYSVSNINNVESVIAQVPLETPVGNVSVEVRVEGGLTSTVNNVPIRALAPDFFETTDSQGRRYAVATKADGSYVSVANPARPGDTIWAYLTGMGQTTPATATNRAGVANQNVAGNVIVGINYQGVPFTSAQLLEGVVGVYVVEFQVPTEVATDPNDPLRPLDLSVAGTDGQQVFAAGSRLPVVR